MISKTINASPVPTLWIGSRTPDVMDLIYSISRVLLIEIEYFHQNLKNKNSVISVEKILKSEYFSYQENSQDWNNIKIARTVNIEDISEFIQNLYKEFKFSTECLILTIVYIKKFLLHSAIPLMSDNWKNILLISTLIAQRASDNALISASDYKNISCFSLDDIRLMEIEYLNIINYDYTLEVTEYLNQVNYLQDISKSLKGESLHLDHEKLENIIKRAKWLSEGESDDDCGIYHSEAMYSIDLDEIDY